MQAEKWIRIRELPIEKKIAQQSFGRRCEISSPGFKVGGVALVLAPDNVVGGVHSAAAVVVIGNGEWSPIFESLESQMASDESKNVVARSKELNLRIGGLDI